MPNPPSVEPKIRELLLASVPASEIARITGAAIKTVHTYSVVLRAGFQSHREYQEAKVKQKYSISLNTYKKKYKTLERIKRTGKIEPIKTSREYLHQWAKENGYRDYSHYSSVRHARKYGFTNLEDHYKFMRVRKVRWNRQRTLLRNLVRKRLLELGKTQRWLGDNLDKDESQVSRWLKEIPGYDKAVMPRLKSQAALFRALELPYKRIKDAINDPTLDDRLLIRVDPEFISKIARLRKDILTKFKEGGPSYKPVEGENIQVPTKAYHCLFTITHPEYAHENRTCRSTVDESNRLEHFVNRHLRVYLFS